MTSQPYRYGPDNMILMSRDRMAYGGPQVESDLVLGGYVVYISTREPIHLTVNDLSAEHDFLAVVPPFTKHKVRRGRSVRAILIESETVSPEILADERLVAGGSRAQSWAARIEEAFRQWQAGGYDRGTESFDLFFFGEKLLCRNLDRRIALAADRIRVSPDGPEGETSQIAREAALSPSRLRHLFCDQVGVPIRSFRAWKRLRNAIQISIGESSLLDLAMAAGYADATHLCHSVKLYFGEQPTAVYNHWRAAKFYHTNTSEHAAFVRRVNPHLDYPFVTGGNFPAPARRKATYLQRS